MVIFIFLFFPTETSDALNKAIYLRKLYLFCSKVKKHLCGKDQNHDSGGAGDGAVMEVNITLGFGKGD